jgi:3-dehydroquinate dehydratase type I
MGMLCVSLVEKTISDIIDSAKQCKFLGVDIVEIRLDYLQDPISETALQELSKLKKIIDIPLLLTLRPTWEGGLFMDSEENRITILEQAIALKFDYIDFELKIAEEYQELLIGTATGLGVKTIVSYHDYTHTPHWKEILIKIQKCLETESDMAKVVYKNRSYQDTLNVIKAGVEAKKSGYNFSVMGIGNFGHITRLLAPFTGSKIIYASLDDEKKVVDAQVDVNTLLKLWKIIGINNK